MLLQANKKMELRTSQVSSESSFIDVVWTRESLQFGKWVDWIFSLIPGEEIWPWNSEKWEILSEGFKMKLGLLKVTCLMKGCIWGEISMSMLTSLVAQTVKHLSTKRETQVWSLVWEDPLEKEMAIHSRTIAWKIPWTEEPGRLQPMGSQRVGHNWATSLITYLCLCRISHKDLRFEFTLLTMVWECLNWKN